MKGDILFVSRIPLIFQPVECRKNSRSCFLDELIIRFLSYKHYGIDAGNGQVIHFRCESILAINQAQVHITSIEDFARDGVVEVDYTVIAAFPADVIVERAVSMLESNFDGYRIKHNNCEHFSVWCITGEKNGKQDLIREAWQRCLQMPLRTKEKAVAALAFLSLLH